MSKVAQFLAEKSKNRSVGGIPGRKLNRPVANSRFTGMLGIEVELEGANLPTAGYLDAVRAKSGAMWEVHQDGSLRGGLEYTLTQPCNDDEVEGLLAGLFDVFRARNTTLRPSNRCSLHVHYNASQLRVNHITSIIALWTVFEEPLLRWWGDARYKNHFCLSSKDEGANVEAWADFLRTGRLPEGNNLRYTALNIVSLHKYGSLEFRGGGAATSVEQATTWVRFLYRLCEYAKQHYSNPNQLAYDFSERGAVNIFEDICGTEFRQFCLQVVDTVPDFGRSCIDSFYNIQPVVLGFPWDTWLPEISKDYVPNPFTKEPSVVRTVPIPEVAWRGFVNRPAARAPDDIMVGDRRFTYNEVRGQFVPAEEV